MNKLTLFVAVSCMATLAMGQPIPDLQLVTTGFNEPVDIASAGDERLFIVSRHGTIDILHPDLSVSTFLDIDDRVGSGGGEQGLLGLVFHPNYSSNGYFYVNYTDNLGDTRISRFSVDTANADLADPDSELLLIYQDQPANNHNSGDLAFGPDGYLWLCTGNGGGPANGNAQDTATILGKVLRIDVDGGLPYAIPADNPYVGIAGVDEMWALGLRNPWRFSFDRLTGDLWIADVGGAIKEEVNVVSPFSGGGQNFGWQCWEGTYQSSLCDASIDFTFPVFEYNHNPVTGGYSITGGYVYRGAEFPHLYGHYLAVDYVTGNAWQVKSDGAGGYTSEFLEYLEEDITSFGENYLGEIYACEKNNGDIFRLVDLCGTYNVVAVTSPAAAPGVNNGTINLTVTGGNSPYTYLWSNGAVTEDLSSLAPGTYSVVVTDQIGCVWNDTLLVELACGPALDPVVSDITPTSATLSWTDSGAGLYKVQYVSAGLPPGIINTTGNSVSLSGLTPGKNYIYRIRNKCAGSTANYTSSGSFMTPPLREADLSGWNIYPNPASTQINLNAFDPEQSVRVTDVFGRLWQQYPAGIEVISVADWPAGLYFFFHAGEVRSAWVSR